MAWRPSENVIDGVIDNTVPGHVTGWVRFAGTLGGWRVVRLYLTGDFTGTLRGTKLRLRGQGQKPKPEPIDRLIALAQHGTVGLMDYTPYRQGGVYLEWFSDENGRVVLELDDQHSCVLA